MQNVSETVRKRAGELLADGAVSRVIGWKNGEFFYDKTPAVFEDRDGLDDFVYDGFCAANLSKYLIAESRREGKTLAVLKPCDTYGLNQLIKEHRVDRGRVYVLGAECRGMLDIDKIRALGIKGIEKVTQDGDRIVVHTIYGEKECGRQEVLLEKCLCCKGGEFRISDEEIKSGEEASPAASQKRFGQVLRLESMSSDERFAFWRGELSKCIRCNACRNVCPLCSCEKCVFDNEASGVAGKANTDSFEENLFHIIRSFHVAGRCTDCGECSRVCPQHIPLHLLNRKYIKDINFLYGDYQAGADAESPAPLVAFTREDAEPDIDTAKGGGRS